MHDVVIHVQRWKGDRPTLEGEENEVILTHHLVVNGEELRREGSPFAWSIAGVVPYGLLTLDIADPPEEIAAMFSDGERVEAPDGLLRLPIRSLEFVDYVPPPPLTDFERMTAGR